jgi:16S rRNA (cytidine1402-2'-O)-methyltransferase
VADPVVTSGAIEAGRLFVVSTPIGNLDDMSIRAIATLKSVRVVLAEDTRHSRRLLDRYEITTPLESHHEHNEAASTPSVIARLRGGDDVALISDAGTPLISDPGARLVQAVVKEGLTVVPVPGASALLGALVASGLPADRFTFFGFLERKGRERTEALDALSALEHTGVLFEAPPRVAATLDDLAERGCADRPAVVARELTKQFEEIRRGTVGSLAAYYHELPPRGEVVIVLGGREQELPSETELRDRARELRAEGRSARDVVAALVAESGAPRNLAYRLAHES